jgi:hypothetical protein
MRRFPMKRMPVIIGKTGQMAVVLDMALPEDRFDADGQPRAGEIPDDTRCWIEIADLGQVSRREIAFGELKLA